MEVWAGRQRWEQKDEFGFRLLHNHHQCQSTNEQLKSLKKKKIALTWDLYTQLFTDNKKHVRNVQTLEILLLLALFKEITPGCIFAKQENKTQKNE